MKRISIHLAAALTIAAVALTGCKKDTPTAPTPVITITTQPTAPAAQTEGSVAGSLTVAATATEGATLTYQWYSNTAANNTGGTAISGAAANTYTLPATLTAGTYHYFCEVSAEGASAVRTSAVTVTVAALPYADYFGEWKFTAEDNRWMTVSISANKLKQAYYDGRSYTLEDLTWETKTEPKNNVLYPTGYRIVGTLTADEGASPNRPDLSGNAEIGEQAVVFWYMATDKNALAEGSGFVTYHPADTDYIFVKQSNQ